MVKLRKLYISTVVVTIIYSICLFIGGLLIDKVSGLENDERVSKFIGLEWEISDPTLFKTSTLSSRPNSVLYAPKYDEIKEDKMVNLKGTAYLEDKTKTVTYKLHIKANS